MTLDELVIELGIDTSKFSKDQQDALDKFGKMQAELTKRLKDIERTSKDAAFNLGGVASAAEGLFTTLAGAGLAVFARDQVNAASATGRMATNIGVATQELDAFGKMIERNGGNADAASSSLKGLTDQMQRAKWGQASPDFLMGLSQVGGGLNDTPIDLFFKLAKMRDKGASVQDVNLAGHRLGLEQGTINEALKGSVRALEDYNKAMALALSPEQAAKMQRLQDSWVRMDQDIESVGRNVITKFADPLSTAATSVADFTEKNKGLVETLGVLLTLFTGGKLLGGIARFAELLGMGGLAKILRFVPGIAGKAIAGGGVVGGALELELMMKEDDAHGNPIRDSLRNALRPMFPGAFPENGSSKAGSSERMSAAEREKTIREMATRFGIDPDVAMKVARSEGFNNFTGDNGTSFGSFQLHVTPGGKGRALGDQFREKTGLDPSDPRNEAATIQFALSQAARTGWKDFHGARNTGIGDWQGVGSVNIGSINLPGVTDAKGFSEALPGAIMSQSKFARTITTNANSGQRP
jgi:hypothetical protein